jgi:hypothetical protein
MIRFMPMKWILMCWLLLPFFASAQDCYGSARVTAPSGLRMRAKPTTQSAVVGVVPMDQYVNVCPGAFGTLVVEGIQGDWKKVTFNGLTGYAFSGFLAELPVFDPSLTDDTPIEQLAEDQQPEKTKPPVKYPYGNAKWQVALETVNYCGDIASMLPGINWYGVSELRRKFMLVPIELLIIKSKYNLSSKLEFDIATQRKGSFKVLIGCTTPLDTQITFHLVDEKLGEFNGKLMPGQSTELFGNHPTNAEGKIQLMALGSLEASEGGQSLKNYKLNTSYSLNNKVLTQDIAPLLPTVVRSEPPKLLWFGDVTNDGFPELIWADRQEDRAWITLLVSNPNHPGGVYQLGYTFSIDPCEE